MLASTSFSCFTQQGVYVCKANNNEGLAIYQRLQTLIKGACLQLMKVQKDIPPAFVRLPADGVIGPILALATQRVLAALAFWVSVPPRLRPVMSYQANEEEIIKRIAENADEIIGYINFVLMEKPDALVTRPNPRPKKGLGGVMEGKLKTVGVVGTTLASIAGLGYIAHAASKRKKGLIDWADRLLGGGKNKEDEDQDDDEE